jgi:exonuclease III
MKIITWNCQGAFRKKVDFILALKPDILVIQECEHPDKLLFDNKTKKPTDVLWFGDNHHKGLGIFSYSACRFAPTETYTPNFKIIAPITVTGGSHDFTLFAIWANNPSDKKKQYVGQIYHALKHYAPLLNNRSVVLTGDFNSNKIWDRATREENHSAVVEILAAKGIHSFYHHQFSQEQGKEKHPTFYLHRDKKKPYHLDYFFASNDLLSQLQDVKVGTYKKWITHSDHSPIIVEINKK